MNDITVICRDRQLFELIYNELDRLGYSVGDGGECRLLITDELLPGLPDRSYTVAISRHPEHMDGELDLCLRRPILMSELREAVRSLLDPNIEARDEPQNDRALELIAPGRVRYCGREVELTDTEYRLLGLLSDRRGEAVGRDELNELMSLSGNAVDVYVCYLRKKLTVDERNPIATLRGQGYMLK